MTIMRAAFPVANPATIPPNAPADQTHVFDRTHAAADRGKNLAGRLARAALLVARDRRQFGDPGARRAEPVLLLRGELVALAQGADAQHVHVRIVARRR